VCGSSIDDFGGKISRLLVLGNSADPFPPFSQGETVYMAGWQAGGIHHHQDRGWFHKLGNKVLLPGQIQRGGCIDRVGGCPICILLSILHRAFHSPPQKARGGISISQENPGCAKDLLLPLSFSSFLCTIYTFECFFEFIIPSLPFHPRKF